MTSPDSPFISSPSANNFSSVFIESPDKISREFERCRPPRKRNSLTVSLSSDTIFLRKPSEQSGRTPPIAPLPVSDSKAQNTQQQKNPGPHSATISSPNSLLSCVPK